MSSVYKIENEFYMTNQIREEIKSGRAKEMIQDMGQCPRSADEAYSMGVKMQGFIGGIMAENISEAGSREEREAVKRQLAIKNRIRQLADFNLNQLLDYFYNNGGPVIEPPVSEHTAKDIQPFFRNQDCDERIDSDDGSGGTISGEPARNSDEYNRQRC